MDEDVSLARECPIVKAGFTLLGGWAEPFETLHLTNELRVLGFGCCWVFFECVVGLARKWVGKCFLYFEVVLLLLYC